MRVSELAPDISQERYLQSSVQTLESIKASMEVLVARVSDMVEILEAWELDYTKEQEIQEMN